MAEKLSSPNHYVACTGDYDCAADEHIEGCGIVDKRAADEQRQADPYDAAVIEFIRRFKLDYFACSGNGGPDYIYDEVVAGRGSVRVDDADGRSRFLPLDS